MDAHARLHALLAGLLSALALAPGCGGKADDTIPFTCENPQPEAGYARCDGGWTHRPEVLECPSILPRPDACPDGVGDCSVDADCTARPNGACESGLDGCYCDYGCRTDADCDAGQVCMCGDPVGSCTEATCTVDADCGGDALCAAYTRDPGCPGLVFACQTADDECVSAADCPADHDCSIADGATHRTCISEGCVVGRPFLVAGDARLAPPVARADWSADLTPDLAGLDPDVRAALADHWTRAGRMEHASIAAFARFALQLLAVGAPPRLLVDTHAAMADELEHARICFALAGAYAGRDLGPGPLDVAGALTGGIREFVATAILEGCIGETVAALEAREAAAHAVDPVVRAALARIADDETRHAALAWRFVQWAVARDPALRPVVDATFAAALAEPPPPPPDARDDLLRHGAPGPAAQRQLRRAVLTAVVAPCARTLLAADAPRPATLASARV